MNTTWLKSSYRTHTCAELRAEDNGLQVTLSGWVHRVRDLGGVVFVDLRDNYGLTQVVFGPELHAEISAVRVESVITVDCKVVPRAGDNCNKALPTGAIEIVVDKI